MHLQDATVYPVTSTLQMCRDSQQHALWQITFESGMSCFVEQVSSWPWVCTVSQRLIDPRQPARRDVIEHHETSVSETFDTGKTGRLNWNYMYVHVHAFPTVMQKLLQFYIHVHVYVIAMGQTIQSWTFPHENATCMLKSTHGCGMCREYSSDQLNGGCKLFSNIACATGRCSGFMARGGDSCKAKRATYSVGYLYDVEKCYCAFI